MRTRRPAWSSAAIAMMLALGAAACGQSDAPPTETATAEAAATEAASSGVTAPATALPTARAVPTTLPVAATETAPSAPSETPSDASTESQMPTNGLLDGEAPMVLGVGRAVGVTPDGTAVITTAAHPGGYLSCENSPAEAFWLVPLDGSPRTLVSEHQIHSGGLDSFSIHDGKAVWMQWCDGYPIGPYVASIGDAGQLSDIELLELPYEPGNELGNPTWFDDGTLSVALAGQGVATMLIVDPVTGATTAAGEVPANEAFPQRTNWQWEAASQRWIVPLPSGAELAIPGFGSDFTRFHQPVEHPTQPVVFLSMPSETPAWFQVVAVPFTAPSSETEMVELVSGLPSATALVGGWDSANQVLLPLRDGERWLMQTVDPVEPCAAELFIRSLNGVDQPIGADLVVRPIVDPLVSGSDLMFSTGCPGGPHSLTWASLRIDGEGTPELAINAIAKVPFAKREFFHSFEINNDQLQAGYGDPRLDTIVALDRDGVLHASSIGSEGYGPDLRDPLCEIATAFPPNWSANIAGGGAGGIELDHPLGATILAVCTPDDLLDRFEIDPRNNPQQSPAESVSVRRYNPERWYSIEDPLNATRWRLATATDGQPGVSEVLQAQTNARWIHVIGNAPGAAALDPDLVGQLRSAISEVSVGKTQG